LPQTRHNTFPSVHVQLIQCYWNAKHCCGGKLQKQNPAGILFLTKKHFWLKNIGIRVLIKPPEDTLHSIIDEYRKLSKEGIFNYQELLFSKTRLPLRI